MTNWFSRERALELSPGLAAKIKTASPYRAILSGRHGWSRLQLVTADLKKVISGRLEQAKQQAVILVGEDLLQGRCELSVT
jgi:hypothetical protein